MEVHELSRSTESGGQVLPLSEGMLHQLLKSALTLEVDATGGWNVGGWRGGGGALAAHVCVVVQKKLWAYASLILFVSAARVLQLTPPNPSYIPHLYPKPTHTPPP